MIDTHCHIYDEAYDADRSDVILRAKNAGVEKIIMPNEYSASVERMLQTESDYPDFCYASIGLHPTCVKENYEQELAFVEMQLKKRQWIAIGEMGLDFYWDKTFEKEQVVAFKQQLAWAIQYRLPAIIHTRKAMQQTLELLKMSKNNKLTGVFHCFSGSAEEAKQILALGKFKFGIGGILTFKNSHLTDTLQQIPLSEIILETDAPYLAPTPYRGTRNESAYLTLVVEKLAQIYNCSTKNIIETTTQTAKNLFFGEKND